MIPSDTVKLDFPARPEYLPVAAACVTQIIVLAHHMPHLETLAYDIQLAVQEACANIVDHAYGRSGEGRIEMTVRLTLTPAQLVVELYDTGEWFDIDNIPAPSNKWRGRGLGLIRRTMDEVEYERQVGGNRWRLVKNLERPPSS